MPELCIASPDNKLTAASEVCADCIACTFLKLWIDVNCRDLERFDDAYASCEKKKGK
jgi:hypothetical protein